MKKIHIETTFSVYDHPEDLPLDDQQLIQTAKAAAEDAYAPYSNFRVGAALLLENGIILKGSNQENAAYPVGLCAERVAIFSAGAQYPNQLIKKIAITIKSSKGTIHQPVAPCGSCRQAMLEYEMRQKQPIPLLLHGDDGPVYHSPDIRSLLPLVFDASFLQ